MIYKRKELFVQAEQVTHDNLEYIESKFNGSIKGTALPRNERCIDFWSGCTEYRANIGDYVTVCVETCVVSVYTEEHFNDQFETE